MFVKNKFETEAFSEICYVGIKTSQAPTNFAPFHDVLRAKIQDNNVRAPRSPVVMFHSLKVLIQITSYIYLFQFGIYIPKKFPVFLEEDFKRSL